MTIQADYYNVLFITASKDGTSKLWDRRTCECIRTYEIGRPLNAAAISPLMDHIIIGGGESAMEVTQTVSTAEQFKIRFFHSILSYELGSVLGHFGPVNALDFSPDGKSFVSGSEDGFCRVHFLPDSYFNRPDEMRIFSKSICLLGYSLLRIVCSLGGLVLLSHILEKRGREWLLAARTLVGIRSKGLPGAVVVKLDVALVMGTGNRAHHSIVALMAFVDGLLAIHVDDVPLQLEDGASMQADQAGLALDPSKPEVADELVDGGADFLVRRHLGYLVVRHPVELVHDLLEDVRVLDVAIIRLHDEREDLLEHRELTRRVQQTVHAQ